MEKCMLIKFQPNITYIQSQLHYDLANRSKLIAISAITDLEKNCEHSSFGLELTIYQKRYCRDYSIWPALVSSPAGLQSKKTTSLSIQRKGF